MENQLTFKQGVQACLPTILGYIGIGFAMGVVGKDVGLGVFTIAMMSILVYAGSAQFIICGLLSIHAPLFSIVLTVFLVNLRHFLMSLSVAPMFNQDSLLTRIGIGSLLTDESYGVVITEILRKHPVNAKWMNGLNLAAYISWIIATILGALFGGFITNPSKYGLDFALVAMFLGLFLFQVEIPLKKHTKSTVLILIGILVSLIILMRISTSEIAVLGATLLGCLIGVMTHDAK